MRIEINKRDLSNLVAKESSIEQKISRYNSLKEKLKVNFKKEIHNKIETMKVLKEIKDNEYYKLDNYRTFEDFSKEYRLARTQVYQYLRLANAIEEGIIEENFLIKNGINDSLIFLKDKQGKRIKKSKINPIKPLRFQLKNQDSYDYYKKNAKLTSFILDELFRDKKDWLEEFVKRFQNLKNT
ncbi:chromosome replication/partitioning protein [Borrelia miyamotoi]|uniref:Chromosome replication/partitioning protein n=1 Tax=Borrelia miyamotoi TaxID=47466 RepID=A0AAQ2WXF1_9SPIR|nr:chromosome replication/partitioning protein [Borrelia miyamotoi]QTL83987.1 chromosome replication/partitioning protein [Borrelia miyamotoi]WAZ85622.1 chromosome replication/partitioning protein [Borrelia miyamotoi]WAZ91406.1 chromosome replication/partitioning protein [Borrelia miyamotoi]WAZ92692.1 chromosome replication/partitioning protein [Borrelia miyamotoi]WAZ93983.1 chromosome replication/partitioning protein [Borrelia miyamotoi]